MSMSLKPFLKWAGGKTQLLPVLSEHVPFKYGCYYEPFLGGGALLFHLLPPKAFVSDINAELINCYQCLQSLPEKVTKHLDSFPINQDFFHELRAADRAEDWQNRESSWKAARVIYLNKTCYNGLYRVNRKGEVNSPWGYYDNPTIYEPESLDGIRNYLSDFGKRLVAEDFQIALTKPVAGDFVYLDPPYDILSDTASFTGYSAGGFHKEHHVILKKLVDELTAKDVKVLQSNADTPFIRNLYKDYKVIEVQAKRSINSKGNKRGNVTELLIKNY
jgi:DNA adenine methylase